MLLRSWGKHRNRQHLTHVLSMYATESDRSCREMVLCERRGGARNPDWRDWGSRKLSPEPRLEKGIRITYAQGGAGIPDGGDGMCKGTEEAR